MDAAPRLDGLAALAETASTTPQSTLTKNETSTPVAAMAETASTATESALAHATMTVPAAAKRRRLQGKQPPPPAFPGSNSTPARQKQRLLREQQLNATTDSTDFEAAMAESAEPCRGFRAPDGSVMKCQFHPTFNYCEMVAEFDGRCLICNPDALLEHCADDTL
eukprot:526956-Karenia_brevis.AAC.1